MDTNRVATLAVRLATKGQRAVFVVPRGVLEVHPRRLLGRLGCAGLMAALLVACGGGDGSNASDADAGGAGRSGGAAQAGSAGRTGGAGNNGGSSASAGSGGNAGSAGSVASSSSGGHAESGGSAGSAGTVTSSSSGGHAESGGSVGSGGSSGSDAPDDCGNGRVDVPEECDGTSNCTRDCTCVDGHHPGISGCEPDQTCAPNSCQPHATCDDTKGIVACTCPEPWTGELCDSCIGGYHLSNGANPSCVEDETCLPSTCNNHGTCADDGGVIACTCDSAAGYTGTRCESCLNRWELALNGTCAHVDYCKGKACLAAFACTSDWNAQLCKCNTGYKGANCDACNTGYFDDGGVAFPKCIPNPCYGLASDVCGWGACVPKPGGASYTCNCTDNNAELKNGKCVCKTGYMNGTTGCVPVPTCPGVNQIWDIGLGKCVCKTGYQDSNTTDPELTCTACASGYVDHNKDGICTSTTCTAYPLDTFCPVREQCYYDCDGPTFVCQMSYLHLQCVDNSNRVMQCEMGMSGFYLATIQSCDAPLPP